VGCKYSIFGFLASCDDIVTSKISNNPPQISDNISDESFYFFIIGYHVDARRIP
jgi:hypothetical protein